MLPFTGPGAAHTGANCIAWCGHLPSEELSVVGNRLAGAQGTEATAQVWRDAAGRPLAERLLQHRRVAGSVFDRFKIDAALRQIGAVMPACVLRGCATDKVVIDLLLSAAAIGLLDKENASNRGAEVGCQGDAGLARRNPKAESAPPVAAFDANSRS